VPVKGKDKRVFHLIATIGGKPMAESEGRGVGLFVPRGKSGGGKGIVVIWTPRGEIHIPWNKLGGQRRHPARGADGLPDIMILNHQVSSAFVAA
jgi:hypothetical protein